MNALGLKSRTSPAQRMGREEASKPWISPMPQRPETRPSQKASVPVPRGVTAPVPVMTMRFSSMAQSPIFRKARQALWPPKPRDTLTAASKSASRAVRGT